MKNVQYKSCVIIILTLLLCTCAINGVQAVNIDASKFDPMSGNIGTGGEFSNVMKKIVSIAQLIGSGVSIITLALIAIKYMLGSVEEKAEYKKSLMPYLVGAIFVFCIVNILAMFEKLVGSVI